MCSRYSISLFMLLLSFAFAAAQDNYKLGPDSLKQDGVPEGKVTQMPAWKSDIFPGTVRDWWIYVPAQYDDKKPSASMVQATAHSQEPCAPTRPDLPEKISGCTTVSLWIAAARKSFKPPGK